jgi:RHS repeat-associated protein
VDASTGLVFLRARYYEPATGRFLSRDPFPGYAAIPALQHPYVYALNNPLRYTDPNGEIVLSAIVAGAAIGGAIGGIGGAIIGGASYVLTTDDFSWKEPGKSTLKGGVTGLAAGAVAGSLGAAAPVASTFLGSVVQSAGIGAVASGVGQGLDYVLTTDDFSWGGLGSSVGLGMRNGIVGGALGGAVGWGTNGLLSQLASRFGGVGALSDQAAWGMALANGLLGGTLGGGLEQIAYNLLFCHEEWHHNLVPAMVTSGASGLIGGGLGHWWQTRNARQNRSIPYHTQKERDWCGAACGQMVAESFGYDVSQADIIANARTYVPGGGMNFSELPEVFQRLGLELKAYPSTKASLSDIESAISNGQAVIVSVDEGLIHGGEASRVGHGIVITHMDSERVWFHDPLLRRNDNMPRESFGEAWKVSDRRMMVFEE